MGPPAGWTHLRSLPAQESTQDLADRRITVFAAMGDKEEAGLWQ